MINLSKREIFAEYNLTTYHGTDGRFLKSILEKGLKAQKPQGRFDKGVYLTSEIEKAARYAIDGIEKFRGIPVILEIIISKKQRIKKIYRDMLDRDEEHLYDEYNNYNEDLESLNRDIKEILQKSMPNVYVDYQNMHDYQLDLDDENDISNLRGINIYKNILNFARKKEADINKVKQIMFSIIPPETNYGNIIISQDGTLKIDISEIEGMHQQIYPKDLPSSVIKAVWVANVPKNISGERISVSPKLLPQESKRIFEETRKLFLHYGFDKQLNEDKIEKLIENIEEINQGGWFDEDIEAIKKDPSKIGDILMSMEEFSNERSFEGLEGKPTEFVKMNPNEAEKYIQKIINKDSKIVKNYRKIIIKKCDLKHWNLFLDDERNPKDNENWTVARTVQEAKNLVINKGLPLKISLDHDIDENGTGYDFVKWLIEQDLEKNIDIPKDWDWNVHSANPVGAKNMSEALKSYLKFKFN